MKKFVARKFFALFSFAIAALALSAAQRVQPTYQNGDIILQTSLSSQSEAIQLATHSQWTHVAIVFFQGATPYVYEAEGPVGFRLLSAFIASGAGGEYLLRRVPGGLSTAQVQSLYTVGQGFYGLPYDPYFDWSDNAMYCSELVWKMYDRALNISVGTLQQLKDFDLSSPQVQAILAERYGSNIPYDETVVSPAAIAESANLVTVYQN